MIITRESCLPCLFLYSFLYSFPRSFHQPVRFRRRTALISYFVAPSGETTKRARCFSVYLSYRAKIFNTVLSYQMINRVRICRQSSRARARARRRIKKRSSSSSSSSSGFEKVSTRGLPPLGRIFLVIDKSIRLLGYRTR